MIRMTKTNLKLGQKIIFETMSLNNYFLKISPFYS